jgi:hypothetical protein
MTKSGYGANGDTRRKEGAASGAIELVEATIKQGLSTCPNSSPLPHIPQVEEG